MFAVIVLLLYQSDISGMIARGVELDVLGETIKGASGEAVTELISKETQLRDAVSGLVTKLREQAELNKQLIKVKALTASKKPDIHHIFLGVSIC